MSDAKNSRDNKFPKNETVYILITQCMQNGFLLADDSRLVMDQDIVAKMLLPPSDASVEQGNLEDDKNPNVFFDVTHLNRRVVKDSYNVEEGPLHNFLSNLMDKREENMDTLHCIHIRDWHKPSRDYDVERGLYGPHCEEGTWEAQALEGFEDYLSPWGEKDGDAWFSVNFQGRHKTEYNPAEDPNFNAEDFSRNPEKYFVEKLGGTAHKVYDTPDKPTTIKNVIHYPVLSDSVFDFRRADTIIDEVYDNEFREPREIMDDDNSAIKKTNPVYRSPAFFELLINGILNLEQYQADQRDRELRVNIVVIGVYTDIKIRTLLTGIRSRYRIANLVVSDVLTAAPSLERHLEALDYVRRVLQVEVIHSLNDLINVLAPGSNREINAKIIKDHVDFRDYWQYNQNKQNFLAYQDKKRIEYLELTQARSRAIYNQVYISNKRLTQFGTAFLLLTIILAAMYVLSFVVSWINIPPDALLVGGIVTGGMSIAQLVIVFFSSPLDDLKENLEDLIEVRSELETHSLILALVRYHFSTPERLSENYLKGASKAEIELEQNKLKAIERQIRMIEDVDFKKFRYRLEQSKKDDTNEQNNDSAVSIQANVSTDADPPPTSAG